MMIFLMTIMIMIESKIYFSRFCIHQLDLFCLLVSFVCFLFYLSVITKHPTLVCGNASIWIGLQGYCLATVNFNLQAVLDNLYGLVVHLV